MKKYDCEPESIGNCNEHACRYFDEKMELNCAYSNDNSKCIKTEKPINYGYPLLADVLALTHEEIVSIACEYNIKGYGIGIEFYDGYRVGFVSGIKYIIDRLKGQVC
jgi:hypothetical protein